MLRSRADGVWNSWQVPHCSDRNCSATEGERPREDSVSTLVGCSQGCIGIRAFKFGGGIIFRACHYANGRLAIAQGFRFSMNYSFLTVSPLLAGTKQTLTDQRNFPVAQSTEYLLSVFQVRGAALGSVPGCRGQGRALCDLGAHAPAEQRSNKLVHVSMEEHDPWSGGSEPGR